MERRGGRWGARASKNRRKKANSTYLIPPITQHVKKDSGKSGRSSYNMESAKRFPMTTATAKAIWMLVVSKIKPSTQNGEKSVVDLGGYVRICKQYGYFAWHGLPGSKHLLRRCWIAKVSSNRNKEVKMGVRSGGRSRSGRSERRAREECGLQITLCLFALPTIAYRTSITRRNNAYSEQNTLARFIGDGRHTFEESVRLIGERGEEGLV